MAGGQVDLVSAGLTEAEFYVAGRLVRGEGPADIADGMGIPLLAVRFHIKRAYAKLRVQSKDELLVRLTGCLIH